MLEHGKDLLILMLFAGFGGSGIAAFFIGFWLGAETSDDRRSMRARAIAALRGEWPDLPAAIWYRRACTGVIGCWSASVLLVVVITILKELF